MAQFINFPAELMREVFHQVHPDDIVNFILASKRINTVLSPLMGEHRARKLLYSTVEHVAVLEDEGWLSTDQNLVDLLKIILTKPRVGHYVKRLIIKAREEDRDHPAHEQANHLTNRRCSQVDIDAFIAAASAVAGSEDLEELLCSALENSDKAAVVCLLMLHCPNLSSFELENRGTCPTLFFDMFEILATTTNHKHLTELKHVRFKHESKQDGYVLSYSFRPLVHLLHVSIEVSRLPQVFHLIFHPRAVILTLNSRADIP